MRVLLITAMWPTAHNPAFGSFVHAQFRCIAEAGIQIEPLVLQGEWRKLIYPRGVWQLNRRLSQSSYDVVHAHYGYVGWVARCQWSAPLVVTYHGDDVLGTVGPDGRLTAGSRIAAGVCRTLGRFADAVIVQNRQMAARFPGSKTHVIPHEVELSVFKPVQREDARRALGLDMDTRYALFAANPEIHVKRFPLARQAWDLVRKQHPDTKLIVIWKEPQDRLALYMSACDVLVFPSYQEGSPNIVKQAMACNLPIVATDVGDVRDIIADTPDCHVCPPDAAAIAEAMGHVLSHRRRTDGRKRIERLSGPNIARRVIQVYEQVLNRRATVSRSKAEEVV